MRKIFQYILMAVAVVATASCSNELDEALQPAHNGTLQFVVSDFPAFGEDPETRAIGNQDVGKTDWAKDDQIIITLTSDKYGVQSAALTYNGTSWSTAASLSYLENETPTVSAIYAPCNEVTGNTKELKTGMLYGMTEYLVASDCQVVNNTISISFDGVTRDYSRLRIAALAEQELSVTTKKFTPAGTNSEITDAYTFTVTADENGNAFLYGTFAKDATVTVMYGAATLAEFTFSEEKGYPNGTEQGKSYALDARPIIDGTLGGDTDVTDDDIKALVDKLKYYVDNGITTIIVPGSNPATYSTVTAIGEAIYRLSGSSPYDADNQYNGKIDLILSDVTEIVDYEFQYAYALNSINLPKVTTIGDGAFYHCQYLQELTFGSVVILIKENHNKVFDSVGNSVGGCDLVLNREQVNAETEYRPNYETKTWWKTYWNYIELI